MLWLLDNPQVSGLFNMGSGEARSFAELIGALFAALGREPSIAYVDTPEDIRATYQYFTRAEMGRLRTAGFAAPFRTLDDGVAAYVAGLPGQQRPLYMITLAIPFPRHRPGADRDRPAGDPLVFVGLYRRNPAGLAAIC